MPARRGRPRAPCGSHGFQQLGLHAAVPYAAEMVAVGGLMSVLGGLAVVFGGEQCGGAILLLFLAPVRRRGSAAPAPCARLHSPTHPCPGDAGGCQVTVVMHNFWAGEALDKEHMIHFLKNMALMGACLLLLFPARGGSGSGKVKKQ